MTVMTGITPLGPKVVRCYSHPPLYKSFSRIQQRDLDIIDRINFFLILRLKICEKKTKKFHCLPTPNVFDFFFALSAIEQFQVH